MVTNISFNKDIFQSLSGRIGDSAELNSLKDLMEQVSGEIKIHFEKAEIQLIVKLSKID